ncbi:tRNA-specific 2-thiouridylase MnmA [Sedimentisphaera cyanobacteriorum]|uniref:tRNA-specific 2-thiouridylase MnmA n=1 Tax=Sedimentisphaera cyanobacteriorum TaxID=1940790 RepID=A0A1Q2HR51_9BACT|nr:tRNA 2-thiouridine(34) synthase MnmA [Sedimentisphaera cyanobacteriorum]AQQ09811.1 tRNA-specific 2-thiouridylase MnmA [Sedimentisphaera cyanobacteriorum]
MGKEVCIAMSGGVDSSAAAALLRSEGFKCFGVFMITHEKSGNDREDAEKMAEKLGIKLHVVDLRDSFKRVMDYFVEEYKRGRTPNPCVYCNRIIKFGELFDYARQHGAEYFATGHYIHQKNGRIYAGIDEKKEQSYILSMVDRNVLSRVLFPLGLKKKQQIRKIARDLGLEVHDKPDSQEICFISEENYFDRLERERPDIVKKGSVYDTEGNLLGSHEGIHRYTIGKRRGLGIALGKPMYVVDINSETNTVVLGEREDLLNDRIVAEDLNWLTEPIYEEFEARVKIRYNSPPAEARVYQTAGRLHIEFAEPVSAATPGQAAAVYVPEGDKLVLAAGGWIGRN